MMGPPTGLDPNSGKPWILCPDCDCPMLPPGVKKRPNEYDHASGCPRDTQLTASMRKALDIAAASEAGTLIPLGGGYWVAGGTPRELRNNLLEGREPRPPFVGTKTVYACADRGLLKGMQQFTRHSDPHRITDAGRALLSSSAERSKP